MAKKIVKVFPDYCSSGLWDERGVGVNERKMHISKLLRIALEHWHYQWETWQIDMGSEKPPAKVWLNIFYRHWWDNGKIIAEHLQEENPDLEIQYKADTPEELIKYFYGEE